jgi:hypothetical protein
MIVAGHYSYGRKLVAYRNDYCLHCEAPRRAYRVRSFEVLHIFFVPLLPLGFWRAWQCSVCGRDPHTNPRVRKVWLWAVILILAAASVGVWMTPMSELEHGDDVMGVWVGRFLLPLIALFMLYHMPMQKPRLQLKEKLSEVQPAQESICPLCESALIPGDRWRCSKCGVERDALTV